MRRFLMALALVAVAGATYVATAPGGQDAGPTAQQFAALKKQVATLQKDLKNTKKLVIGEGLLLLDCMAVAVPVDQFGDGQSGTYGYSYQDPQVNGGVPFLTTALDAADPTDSSAVWFTGGSATCGTDVNGLRRHGLSGVTGVRPHGLARISPFHARKP